MGERIRNHDWARTSLGPPDRWPKSLQLAVRIILASRQAFWIGWGKELIYFYNDPYRAIIGGKHPHMLGQPTAVVWHEIWDIIEPMLHQAMDLGSSTYVESQRLIMERNGYPEETYYTFSYSPIPDDDGRIGGILCANTDDTQRVINARQLELLHELATTATYDQSPEDACRRSAEALAKDPWDLPVALIYRESEIAGEYALAGAAGIDAMDPAVPRTMAWPEGESSARKDIVVVDDPDVVLAARLPAGARNPTPRHLALVALGDGSVRGLQGILVVGLSPYRLFTADYRNFLRLVGGQISASIVAALAYASERQRAEALAEIDRAKTVFFSNVSHEFRTPLTLMLGPIADVLSQDSKALPTETREQLVLAQRNGLRLQRLVNTLLDFSRLEAGRMQARYEPVDLTSFTAELAEVFRSACDRAGLVLKVDCQPLGQKVFVDRSMWEKIVLNLISNAFKFTLQGSIVVSLRMEESFILMRIEDTGIGIPAEELPRLFERFHRIEGRGGRTHEGSGIGLALVADLVNLHGGHASAASELGKGTVFEIRIPFGTDHLPAEQVHTNVQAGGQPPTQVEAFVDEALRCLSDTTAPLPAEEASVVHEDDALEGTSLQAPLPGTDLARILVVEDNADLRQYLIRLLSGNYTVVAAADGAAALDICRRISIDLVLSDVMMPRLDGKQLLQALRADPHTMAIPVILLSARAGEDSQVNGFEAGANDYLVKPFSARELLARVGAQLQVAKIQHEAQATLRENEARFRTMADHAPVMLWLTEPDGTCSYLSRSWYEFTGHTADVGLRYERGQAVHSADREAANRTFLASVRKREPVRLEYRLRRHDGAYRWVLDLAAPRFSVDGQYLGYIGSVVDISDRKQAEEALHASNSRKDHFLAILAHELRNPLAPLRNGLEVMKLARGNTAAIDRVQALMERQLGQMVRLIDDLMDVSRISRGKITLRKEAVDLIEVVRHAIETSRPLIDMNHHRLALELPTVPVYVEADPLRLAQVFANLLNNAAKYTPNGGRITLTVEQTGMAIVVRVQDSGIGIAAEMLPKVFDAFTQADCSLEKAHGGLGIGLSLVKGLVELHGGQVEAKSNGRGRGSDFLVHLTALSEVHGTMPATGTELTVSRAPCRRILLVDDNQDAVLSLAMVLRILGNDIRTAFDGLEAIDVAARFRPDIVILDLGMPRLNGYDTARRLRHSPGGQRFVLIALTGWGQDDDHRRSQEVGFDFHLVKPVDPDRLNQLLSELSTVGG